MINNNENDNDDVDVHIIMSYLLLSMSEVIWGINNPSIINNKNKIIK